MPRAIWSGSISFGLVNVPVRMHAAIQETDLHFRLVHRTDGGAIGYEKVCKEEGTAVPADEIVKAFELDDGELVYMEDEDFEAARDDGEHTVDIQDFVPYDQIDPIYFERTYYLAPATGAAKVYALLVQAMEASGLAAIAKYTMRDRQHLGCLRIREGVITLEKMFFADEVRPVDELRPDRGTVGRRELDAALQLVERFTGDFDPTAYRDTYREDLCAIIERKRKGEEVHAAPRRREPVTDDIMAALMASLEQAGSRRGSGREADAGDGDGDGHRGRDDGDDDGDLSALSKQELLERARRADIPGRSGMTKDELAAALAGDRA